MAMNFQPASRAETDDLVNAVIAQNQLQGQLYQAEQANRQGYLSSGAGLASAVPEGGWAALGNSLTGGGATAATAAPAASMAAPAASAITGAAAPAATAVPAATGAVTGAGAGTGLSAGLSAIGPVGWAALAALALGSGLF